MKMPRPAWIIADVIALSLVVAVVVFVSRQSSLTTVTGPSPSTVIAGGETTNYHGKIDLYHAKDFEAEVEMGIYFYEPSEIIAPPDFQILLELGNESSETHTFTAPGLGIDEEVSAFDQKVVIIKADPGTYPFTCRFFADKGMRGVIEIGKKPFR